MAVPFADADPPLAPTFLEPDYRAPGRHVPPVPEATPPQPASQQASPSAAISGEAAISSKAAISGETAISSEELPLVVVDGANVVGSVPDGWWRDRAGAAARLRDNLAPLPAAGLAGLPGPVEVVLVVEGKARDIPQAAGGVRIARAPGSGDDKIIDIVRTEGANRRTLVVTADRGLRDRAVALGAEIRGPSAVPR